MNSQTIQGRHPRDDGLDERGDISDITLVGEDDRGYKRFLGK